MLKNRATLAVYSFSHFCVDFCCFYILYAGAAKSFSAADASIAFLIYNTAAFGLQFIIGALCDSRPEFPSALVGCGLTAAGLVLVRFAYPALALCALGNAFFHIGGGIDSLKYSNGRMARSGIFVSTGALGVALGTLLGRSDNATVYIPLGLIAVSAALIAMFCGTGRCAYIYTKKIDVSSNLPFWGIIVFSLVSIAVRAYVGPLAPMGWKTTAALGILPYAAACAGKALGGIVADRFGARTVGTFALIASIPLIVFGDSSAAVSLLGLLLFNFTMPINLCAVFSRMPDSPGLAFGLTTLALLIGTLPCFMFSAGGAASYLIIGLSALSALLTFITVKNRRMAE